MSAEQVRGRKRMEAATNPLGRIKIKVHCKMDFFYL